MKKIAEYDHLTVQTSDIPDELKKRIQDIQSNLDKDILYDGEDEDGWVEGGLQKLFHTTILYGVNPNDKDAITEKVDEVLAGGEFSAKTVEIEYFDHEEEGYSAMVLRIESDGLKKLHDTLKETFENKDKYPDYKTHVTIAYLKAGARVEGVEVEPFEWDIDGVEMSNKDGSLTKIAEDKPKCQECGKSDQVVVANYGDGDWQGWECERCNTVVHPENDEDYHSACLDCGEEMEEETDIQLCQPCMVHYDVDLLWEMHDNNEIDALNFNESPRMRKDFMLLDGDSTAGRLRGKTKDRDKKNIEWEERWSRMSNDKRENKGVRSMDRKIIGQVEISDQMLDKDGMWISRDMWKPEVDYRVEQIEMALGNIERGVNVTAQIQSFLSDLNEILEKIPHGQLQSAEDYISEQIGSKPIAHQMIKSYFQKQANGQDAVKNQYEKVLELLNNGDYENAYQGIITALDNFDTQHGSGFHYEYRREKSSDMLGKDYLEVNGIPITPSNMEENKNEVINAVEGALSEIGNEKRWERKAEDKSCKPLQELNKIVKKKDDEVMNMQDKDERYRNKEQSSPQVSQSDINMNQREQMAFQNGDKVVIHNGIYKNKFGTINACKRNACRVLVGNESIWYKLSEVEKTNTERVVNSDTEFNAIEADIHAGFKQIIDEIELSNNPYVVSEIGKKLYKQQKQSNKGTVRESSVSRINP